MQSLINHFQSSKTKLYLDIWQVIPLNSPNTHIDVKNKENLSSFYFPLITSESKAFFTFLIQEFSKQCRNKDNHVL